MIDSKQELWNNKAIKLQKEYEQLLIQKLQKLEEIIKIETEYLSTMPLNISKAKKSNEKQNEGKLIKLTKKRIET